jgi:hypothetical protein
VLFSFSCSLSPSRELTATLLHLSFVLDLSFRSNTLSAYFLRTAELQKLIFLSKLCEHRFSNPERLRTTFPLSLAASRLPLLYSLSSRPFPLNLGTWRVQPTVLYCTVQYSTVLYSTVLYSTVQYSQSPRIDRSIDPSI